LNDGVRQVELCASFAAIANNGEYNKPIFYTKVLDHSGNVLLENRHQPRQVIKPTTAYLLTDTMRDTIRRGTGGNAGFREVRMPVAGKTGTTTNSQDISFSGYTPYFTASVWVGFDQQKRISNNTQHTLVWRLIMEEIHRDLAERQFERPSGIMNETVCRDSGLLATDLCRRHRDGRTVSEVFATGTQPTQFCDAHMELRICHETEQQASHFCHNGETRIGVARPDRPVISGVSYQDAAHVFNAEVLFGEHCNCHGTNFFGQYNFGPQPGVPSGFNDFDWNPLGNPLGLPPGNPVNNTDIGLGPLDDILNPMNPVYTTPEDIAPVEPNQPIPLDEVDDWWDNWETVPPPD
jgi:penicillin-binding protein 1A